MAKTPPKKSPSVAQRKTKAATKAGYSGPNAVAAQKSVTAQYGLVKNAAGDWVKPDAAFLERQMVANGWGVGQTGVTPVAIGGARWLTGQGQLTFTNQRSDSAKNNPGAAYNAPAGEQTAYVENQKNHKKAGRNTTKNRTHNRPGGGNRVGGGATIDTLYAEGSYEAAPTTTVESIYAEADVSRTGYGAAQGKAYGKGKGSTARGDTGGGKLLKGEEAPAESGGGGGGGGRGGGKKRRPRKHGPKNKRVYQKAKKAKAAKK